MHLLRNLRYALRALRRSRAFSLTVITSLALGFALATVQLAIANAYLIRTLPYPHAERIYHVMYEPPGPHEPAGMSDIDWNALGDVVEAAITATGESFYLGDASSTEFVSGLRVSHGFIEGLGVRPLVGPGFSNDAFSTNGGDEALISYDVWQHQFGGDRGIVGRMIRLRPENQVNNGRTVRIAGVLQPQFWFGRIEVPTGLLLPMHNSDVRTYMVRLRDGVPRSLAEQRITQAARAVGSDFPKDWTGVHLESVHDRYVAGFKPFLVGMSTTTTLVLLLVCTNVAILVLLRTLQRQKEVAVHVALGARSSHVLKLLMAEVFVLFAASLGVSLTLAYAVLRFLDPLVEARIGRPPPAGTPGIGVDAHVVVTMAVVCGAIAIVMSVIPFVASRGKGIASALRRVGHGATETRAMQRMRAALITFEFAGALALVCCSLLMLRSMRTLVGTDLGFDAANVARVRVILPRAYTDPRDMARFYEQLSARLTDNGDYSVTGSFPAFYEPNKHVIQAEGSTKTLQIGSSSIGARYFAIQHTNVLSGREFDATDRFDSNPIAVVSAGLAEYLWPGASPMGRRIRVVEADGSDETFGPWRTVIGVAANVRHTHDDVDVRDVYMPFVQVPTRYAAVMYRTGQRNDAAAIIAAKIKTIDPFARSTPQEMLAAADQEGQRTRFMSIMLGAFAAFGTFLALLGIYGVTVYAVSRRQREIAIRVAVGAPGAAVVAMFVRNGTAIIAAGILCGIPATLIVSRLLAGEMHGVKSFDVPTVLAAVAFLTACGLLATWGAARRAADTGLLTLLKDE